MNVVRHLFKQQSLKPTAALNQILGGSKYVDAVLNKAYLLSCQGNSGGFSKWANTHADILHSYMGLCGLALMGDFDLLPLHAPLDMSQRAFESLKKTVFWAS